jgi:hypothetical protein
MAVGMSSATADNILNAIGNNTSYVIATPYMQLHTAEPGTAGTTSVATETTRKLVSFGAPAAGAAGFRKITNDAAITWTAIAGSQDATHFSLWDASTSGNYLGSGTITAAAYTAGDTYNIAIGAAELTLPINT